ncbi:hypothetical protein KY284_028301 [Solanum tuberosum]|nr:hypothetical protein KY284_028301 [Solanum tuberosum]
MHLPSSAEVTSSDISHWQHDPQKELVVLLLKRPHAEIFVSAGNNDDLLDILTFEKQNLELAIYDCDKFSSLCNEKDAELKVALTKKRSLEMRLPKSSSQGSKKTIPKELADANNQVFEKIHEELKARSMLRTAEETKNRLLSEKSSLEEKIVKLEKKKSSEASERYY